MKAVNSISNTLVDICAVLTIVIAFLAAAVDLGEFVRIGLLKEYGGYPFGGEGPTPWYYKAPRSYSLYCLAFAILFFSVAVASSISFRRKQTAMVVTLFAVLICVLGYQLLVPTD